MRMTLEEAKDYAKTRFKELELQGIPKKIAINHILIELLKKYNFRVACPVTGRPLIGVQQDPRDGVVTYTTI